MSMPKPILLSNIFSILFRLLAISAFYAPSVSAIFAPIQKDLNTNQYFITVYLQTPLRPTNLFLDLTGSLSWVDCTRRYNSTTSRHITCGTPLCETLRSNICFDDRDGPPHINNTCGLIPENPVKNHAIYFGDALVDALALPTTTSPSHEPPLALIPNYSFACSSQSLLTGLSKKVTGLSGFARSNFSLPAQVSSTFNSPYIFALCLPASDKAPGAVVFNTRGPYLFTSGIDLSKYLIYTPLPVDYSQFDYYGRPSDEYFIGVTSVKVNGKALKLNQTLLTIDVNGGGTKISTAVPYTVLHTSIFTALTNAFVKESAALNLMVTTSVKPFGVCFEAKDVSSTRVGPNVPTIDLVMQSEDVYWRVMGANSMVRVQNKGGVDVWCLGFVDGGTKQRTSIVIGGKQLEDNLLQFDVQSKRLGFSSSVLAHGTTCSNFNSNGN